MTFYNRGGDRFQGGQNYGRRDSNRGSDRGIDKPALFDAVCAKCGAACQVPFRPNGRKEVFCSKCFETMGGGSSRDARDGDSRGRGNYEKRDNVGTYTADRQMYSAVCDECGDNCKVPFEPRNGKPVLCSNCFAGKNTDSKYDSKPSFSRSTSTFNRSPRENSVDLDAINAKLDKIIKLLTPKETAKAEAKEVSKDLTTKIIEEIEANSGKKIVAKKKTAKKVAKKKSETKE